MNYPSKPKNLLIYYGWLNAFNSAVNGWDNEKVAQQLAEYDILVFGDGLQDPSHSDYANTTVILNRLNILKPSILIFGYVTVNQLIAPFQTKVDQWDNFQIQGIFLDEAGYDFGKTRTEFNTRIAYVHAKTYSNICFANSWNLNHILGTVNDPSYPNTTFNSTLNESLLTNKDWVLLESLAVNTDAFTGTNSYNTQATWLAKGVDGVQKRDGYGINLAAVGIINDSNTSSHALFNFSYNTALMYSLDANGTSDAFYGASSAATKFWPRSRKNFVSLSKPDPILDGNNASVYLRYGNFAKLTIDHGAQTAVLKKY